MMLRALLVAAIAAVLSCGGQQQQQQTQQQRPAAKVEPTIVLDGGGGSDASDADAAPASTGDDQPIKSQVQCGHLRLVPSFCYVLDAGDPTGALGYQDVDVWLKGHGAKAADVRSQANANLLGANCRPLSVGLDKEEALFCTVQTQVTGTADVYRGVTRARIITVRKSTVATLLDIPIEFSNFDGVGQPDPGAETGIFGVQVDTRESAMKIVVTEPRPGACEAAKKLEADDLAKRLQIQPVVPVEVATMRFDAKLVGTICSSVKGYAWTKGAFR